MTRKAELRILRFLEEMARASMTASHSGLEALRSEVRAAIREVEQAECDDTPK
jgi:hypothetical protein